MEEQHQNKSGVFTRVQTVFSIFKYINFESIATRVFLGGVFLLPLFVLPYGIFPVDFSKAMFAYVGVSLVLLLLILGMVRKGSILIPKSFLLFGLLLVSFAFLISSFVSSNTGHSLVGAGYETSTFTAILFVTILAFLVPVLFRTVNHLALLYKTIFLSAIILFIIQLLHIVGLPLPWGMFPGKVDNILGSWSDLGVFFGFVVLLALSSIELKGEGRKAKMFMWVVLGLSLLAVFFVNFSTIQYVLGFFVLMLLVDRLVFLSKRDESSISGKYIFRDPSFFVFLFVVVCAVAHGLIAGIVSFIGIQYTQVAPTWNTTLEVVKATLSTSSIVGSGPNTFLYDWLHFRPDAISLTSFWNTRFLSGIGRLPSALAETGLMGFAAIAVFLTSLLHGTKKIFLHKQHNLERMLLISSFLSTGYLWVFTIVYSSGIVLYLFTGIMTGAFIAALGFTKELPFIELSFKGKLSKTLPTYFLGGTIIIGALYGVYFFSSKYIAGYFYTKALVEAAVRGDVAKASVHLQKAVALDPQDVYFRSAAELGLLKIRQIIDETGNKDVVSEAEKQQFSNSLTFTVQNAKYAATLNPLEPNNWMELGKVYEAILPFDTEGFKSSAIFSYEKALQVSPKNPTPLLSLARVEYQTGETEEALKFLENAIKLKGDYTDAYLMITEIQEAAGDLKGAITRLDEGIVNNPNSPGNIYLIMRIGALFYKDGDISKARTVFENLVAINPNYVDARYSLGLIYDKLGLSQQSITQFEAIDLLIPDNPQIQAILSNLRSGKDAFGGSKETLENHIRASDK